MVQEHNKQAAGLWDKGGSEYDFVSFGIADALAHTAQALWPKPNEKILDIATGTGWTARNVAHYGAKVTGVDIADELLAAAKTLSAHVTPEIEFTHGDAEALPFNDGEFDAVISTFGIMFAGNHDASAAELARVCKKGGRIALAAWEPGEDSFVAQMFGVVAKHSGAPKPPKPPTNWGVPDYVSSLLSQSFDLKFSNEDSTIFAPDGEQLWNKFYEGFGPVRLLAERLNPDELTEFRNDFIGLHEEYRNERGLKIDRKYLLITGTRK